MSVAVRVQLWPGWSLPIMTSIARSQPDTDEASVSKCCRYNGVEAPAAPATMVISERGGISFIGVKPTRIEVPMLLDRNQKYTRLALTSLKINIV